MLNLRGLYEREARAEKHGVVLMDKKQVQQSESKIELIDEALLEKIAGGLSDAVSADGDPGGGGQGPQGYGGGRFG